MKPKIKLFLPHVYSSLRIVLVRGFIRNMGKKNERRRIRIKALRVAFLLPLFFWGLLEVSPPAQYTLAFIRFF
jgi:hypothetical protein